MVKRITTCLDDEMWRRAMMNNISWAEAIKIGVMVKLGDNSEELSQLKAKLKELDFERKHYENKIKEMESKIKKVSEVDTIVTNHIPLLKSAAGKINQNVRFLRGQTRAWNFQTNMSLSEEEFYQLCKRFDRGEFNVK